MNHARTSMASTTSRRRQQPVSVGEELQQLGRVTSAAARQKLDDARDAVAEIYDQGRQKIGAKKGQVEKYIGQRPLRSVLIAAGAAAVIGFLFGRRR